MMMEKSLVALGVASLLVIGLVVSVGALSLLVGTLEFLFGKAKINILKSVHGKNGFAFSFSWNSAKEKANIDTLRLKLFNPFATNPHEKQRELTFKFGPHDDSFTEDINFGSQVNLFYNLTNPDSAVVQIELVASKDGFVQSFEMKGNKFLNLWNRAQEEKGAQQGPKENSLMDTLLMGGTLGAPEGMEFSGTSTRTMIADTVSGKASFLKIATNPLFQGSLGSIAAGAEGGKAQGAAAPAAENFPVKKVWIEVGCIVCNACMDLYPEVFFVDSKGCYVVDNYPKEDGLRVVEAAEACPVEVIKFEKA